jgi:ATP-dependent DNA ligase
MAATATARHCRDAAAGGATSLEPVRFTARPQPRAWVRPELVVEVKYLTWTDENLLRQVVYEGLREDKDPTDVRRPTPNQSAR